MPNPTPLTDRPTLDQRRIRATRQGFVDFLHQEASHEVDERLSLVNRQFTSPAIVTGAPAFWSAAWPQAKMVADTDTLDLSPESHDLVIHALALHWANDPVGQIIQSRRALRPDGLFLAILFGGQTLHELRACLAETEAALTGGLSPRIAPMGEIRDLGGLLQRANLALPVADIARRKVSYASAFHLMRELRGMGETNALTARHRKPARRALFAQTAALYAENFGTDDGRITATFDLAILTGWAPDATQPQPLRPGSATARLADALGTTEHASGDPTPRRD